MLKKDLFKKPKNPLETGEPAQEAKRPAIPDELCVKCGRCNATLFQSEWNYNHKVCPRCGAYSRLGARERIELVCDPNSFEEAFAGLVSNDPLRFPGYEGKLSKAREESGEEEAVVCGTALIGGLPAALFVMEPGFMLGSMGTALGEKVALLFELAAQKGLPVIGFTVSGGARMQEGILSLMQMAKTSGAVKLHSDGGNLYVCVLTDPTTGGVTASFAMQADIILSEPGALIGFAGPRVIEQTIRQKLPEGFQRAEFLLEKGFVDGIVERKELRQTLLHILKLHQKEAAV
ncbi:MAG TPA: acetyl-CoA carboxylase, carboxyltransferase subunit beta [Feifaniaceae bacterium]|nr:acetyl-CoA carboxylase, carboxyltransferase subunit beta [Feifaniaceae bacterium]